MAGRRFNLGLRHVPAETVDVWKKRSAGFSLTELVVVAFLLMAISAFAIPSVMRSWRAYELTSRATQVASMLKLTRSNAIRLNTTMTCLVVQKRGIWSVGEDLNGDGVLDTSEPRVILNGPVRVYPGLIPDSITMGPAYAGAQSPPAPGIKFDSRGAVVAAPSPVIYVLYIGEAKQPEYGFRAVTVGPSGSTLVWTAPAGGDWQRMN